MTDLRQKLQQSQCASALYICNRVNNDVIVTMIEKRIGEQRKRASFQPRKMGQFLWGQKAFHQFNSMMSELSKLPQLKTDFDFHNKSREDNMINQLRLLKPLLQKLVIGDESTYAPLLVALQHPLIGMVHVGMFLPSIKLLGSQKQFKKYSQACLDYTVYGCYAQTQIGHGSDVRNLQTTATFNNQEQSFLIHTPTLEATKYWPGELGVFANYALVFAQLVVGGANYGVQPFVVQIRDDNGNMLPGVEAGDIGPKIGYSVKDNGYLIFKRAKVGRQALLNRYIKVSKEGQVEFRGNPKIGYATMMLMRKAITIFSPPILSKAISIAVKYSLKRTQFKVRGEELQVLDYQTQLNKVLPAIADYCAMMVVVPSINKLTNKNLNLIIKKDDDSLLNETHSVLSFTKVMASQLTLKHMEWLRMACGGHGYSVYSGFPALIRYYYANVTHQGQNSVLLLQTAKTVVKAYSKFTKKSEPMPDSMRYLENSQILLRKECPVPLHSPVLAWSLQSLRILLAQNSCFLLKKVVEGTQSWKSKMSQDQVLNRKLGIRLVQLARAHASYYYFFKFQAAIAKVSDESLRTVLFDLCGLFGVGQILEQSTTLLESGMVKGQQLDMLRDLKQHYMTRLRPEALGLVDAMGHIDSLGNSLIGGEEEGMYQLMFDQARTNNSMNKGKIDVLPVLREVTGLFAKL